MEREGGEEGEGGEAKEGRGDAKIRGTVKMDARQTGVNQNQRRSCRKITVIHENVNVRYEGIFFFLFCMM